MTSSNTRHASCPQCGARVAVSTRQVGSQVTCDVCLEEFVAEAAAPVSDSFPASNDVSNDGEGGDATLQRLLNPSVADSSPGENTIRLEDDLSSPAVSKPKVLESDYEFGIICHVCATRLTMTDEQVGKKVKCPDCHTILRVREPPPSRRKAKAHVPVADDDDFRLADAADVAAAPEPFQSIASDLLQKAEAETAPAQPAQPLRSTSEEALQRAEQGLQEEEEREPPLPNSPFTNQLLSFLLDPTTIGRLVFYAAALWVLLGAIQMAIVTTEGGALSQFTSILMRMFASTFGLAFIAAFCSGMQGILQDTSNGMDEIESWPDLNFVDWFGEMFFIAGSAFLAISPAFALTKLTGSGLVFLGAFTAGMIAVFPFVLLSMLETGSVINPLSRPIQRSIRLAGGRWIQFIVSAVIVIVIGAGLFFVRVAYRDMTILNLMVAVGFVVLSAVYFRLLGRLAWCCRVAVAEEDTRLEEMMERGGS